MKKVSLTWILLLAGLIGCEDNNKNEDIQSEFILAGVDSDKLNIQLYPSELKIDFKNETAGGSPTTGYSGDLLIDLDSDNSNDIKFHAYYGYGCSMTGGCITKACELWNLDNKEIDIYRTPLEFNDIISNNLTWNKLGPYSKGGELMLWSTTLSSYSPEWIDSAEIMNNVWTSEDFYLAIRIKCEDIYKFGWIRLYIDDFYDIKIKEIGLEK